MAVTRRAQMIRRLRRRGPAWLRAIAVLALWTIFGIAGAARAVDASHLLSQYGHTGWRLQTNTNLSAAKWEDVSGASATNQISFQPADASVFFRLVYP